jgi:hypothetical protein
MIYRRDFGEIILTSLIGADTCQKYVPSLDPLIQDECLWLNYAATEYLGGSHELRMPTTNHPI